MLADICDMGSGHLHEATKALPGQASLVMHLPTWPCVHFPHFEERGNAHCTCLLMGMITCAKVWLD